MRHAVRRPPNFEPEPQNVAKEVEAVAREVAEIKARPATTGTVAVGGLVLYGVSQNPGALWRRADGAEIHRFNYPEFFEAWGEDAGAGDGATTVNLPNEAAPSATTAWWVYIGRE